MLTFIKGVLKPYFSESGHYFEPKAGDTVRLAKVFGKHGTKLDPEMPKFYDVIESVNPTGLEQVKKLLSEYCKNPEIALIRATPVSEIRNIRRTGETFNCSMKSRIIHMDIDGIEIPPNSDIVTIQDQGKYCVSLLNQIEPEMFPLDSAFVAKASGSAGIKPGIRVHLYMLSSIAVSNGQLKWLSTKINKQSKETLGMELLDTSVYDKVHLMYTADPVFEDPKDNPFINRERIALSHGVNITLPDLMPEYLGINNAVKVGKEHLRYISEIDGLRDFPSKDFEKRIENLKSAEDNVFMRHSISVYAAAIEQGVDIPWLDTIVRPILSTYVRGHSKRSVDDYIANAKNAALKIILSRSLRTVEGGVDVSINSAESSILPIKEEKTDSHPKDRYLHINTLPPEDSLTFVKASLGTGKTTTVQTWLASGIFSGRFLAITNTVSLVEGNAKKLGAGCYNRLKDYNDFKTGYIKGLSNMEDTRYERMSTTIHSLHKFKETIDQRGLDFLFIDECDAVMNDILFSDCVKERDKCTSTLALALQKAKYVILSDGDISPETVEAYARLCDPVKTVRIYKHDRKMLAEAEARELFDEQSIWAAMQGSLEIGDKCLLVSDCSPDELNEKGIALREATGCNIKEVHKNSAKDADIREILTYGNGSLIQQDVDALLCSPSVTSGVDFSYFDAVFVITRDSGIHTPNLRFQALRRDRGAKSIYYYNAPQTEGFRTGADAYEERLGWLHRCRKVFAKRREQECQKYQSTFRMLLRDQGCRIIIDPSKWGKVETAHAEYLEERINAILSSTANFQLQRHNDAWEVKQYITHYYDEVDDIGNVTAETVALWIKQKPHERAAFFHKVYKHYWKIIQKCKFNWQPFEQELKKNPSMWYQCTGLDVRTENWRVKAHLARMGIKSPNEFAHIVKWYRTYCKLEGLQIPVEFLTQEEQEIYAQQVADI